MTRQTKLDAIRDALSELSQAQLTVALCVGQLQDLVRTDALREADEGDLPRTIETRFCVIWHNRTYYMGNTQSFRLFARLLRRPGHFIPYDSLLRDVWDGHQRSNDTVRSAIRELKAKLCRAKMGTLAGAIRAEGKHYGLILHGM